MTTAERVAVAEHFIRAADGRFPTASLEYVGRPARRGLLPVRDVRRKKTILPKRPLYPTKPCRPKGNSNTFNLHETMLNNNIRFNYSVQTLRNYLFFLW